MISITHSPVYFPPVRHWETCSVCRGAGAYMLRWFAGIAPFPYSTTTGDATWHTCDRCNGTGYVEVWRPPCSPS